MLRVLVALVSMANAFSLPKAIGRPDAQFMTGWAKVFWKSPSVQGVGGGVVQLMTMVFQGGWPKSLGLYKQKNRLVSVWDDTEQAV